MVAPSLTQQTRRYFLREQSYLRAKVTQARRKGFDHQLLDADFAIPANLIDDDISAPAASGDNLSFRCEPRDN